MALVEVKKSLEFTTHSGEFVIRIRKVPWLTNPYVLSFHANSNSEALVSFPLDKIPAIKALRAFANTSLLQAVNYFKELDGEPVSDDHDHNESPY